jgi:hypothetical protein
MHCPVWRELYEQYEKTEHLRVVLQKRRLSIGDASDLEQLNAAVTRSLQVLREHEEEHRCQR